MHVELWETGLQSPYVYLTQVISRTITPGTQRNRETLQEFETLGNKTNTPVLSVSTVVRYEVFRHSPCRSVVEDVAGRVIMRIAHKRETWRVIWMIIPDHYDALVVVWWRSNLSIVMLVEVAQFNSMNSQSERTENISPSRLLYRVYAWS